MRKRKVGRCRKGRRMNGGRKELKKIERTEGGKERRKARRKERRKEGRMEACQGRGGRDG